jgi:sugar phosphate isomerase/epimerase
MDFFACWAEAGLQESIKRAMPRLQLAQVCDYVYGDKSMPCRAVPGDGAIPIKRMIGWLLDAGYTGAFDLELPGPRIQKEGAVAAVRRSADKVGEILQSLGA